MIQHILMPFKSEDGVHKLLVGIFVLVNSVVLINAVLHEPTIGYDADHHLTYIETLSQMRLPNECDSKEYYSPPLPYLFPAILMASSPMDVWWAAKCAQILKVLLSIALLYYLLKICDLVSPRNPSLKVASIAFLGILPVYYKGFALAYGEPFIAFFSVLVVYQIVLIFVKGIVRPVNVIVLGFAMGGMLLSRQWGILLLPAIILFVGILFLKAPKKRALIFKALVGSLVICLLTGSWFYLGLHMQYSSITAFGRKQKPRIALSNQPVKFYMGLGLDKLFKEPVRRSFSNQFIPIMYSEIWGDYWGYFVIYGKNIREDRLISGWHWMYVGSPERIPEWLETNRFSMSPYLGRVNRISLFPSALALAGILLGVISLGRFICQRQKSPRTLTMTLLVLLIATSLAGYLWFLVMYPNRAKGDTIKASYMLQIFPFVAILAGNFLQRLEQRTRRVYQMVLWLLLIVFVHNLPVYVTHYPAW